MTGGAHPAVLIIDDDRHLVRALRINLRARRYDVLAAPTGAAGLRSAASAGPDLVLLDLGLPDLEGTAVIDGIRGWSRVPIIVMSGRVGGAVVVEALDRGADDYVAKPFSVDELLARMRAQLRRAPSPDRPLPRMRIGDAVIDFDARRVVWRGPEPADVRLTPTEWHLLEKFATHPGKLLTAPDLLDGLRAGPARTGTSYLRVYLAQLRRKLEPDPARPRFLVTEPGVGYRFLPREAAEEETAHSPARRA